MTGSMTTLAPTIRRLKNHIGESVTLRGWIVQKRSSGKIGFLQVRDGSGVVQAVVMVVRLDSAVGHHAPAAQVSRTPCEPAST